VLYALLCLSPVLLLLVPLLAGRYPGERALLSLRHPERPRLRPSLRAVARPRFVAILARGGRLIGCSLAVRPPPSPLPAS
jgi:hypothetical protein